MDIRKLFLGIVAMSLFAVIIPIASAAYPIEKITLDPVRKDFVVGPGKQEFILKPGESTVTEIIVSNRMGEERIFELKTEDFTGSRDISKTVELLGNETSPFSLKRYISFSDSKFVLPNGARARIPVRITIPANAEPGGLYGSLLISTVKVPEKVASDGAQGGVPIEVRQGVLFFIRIPGEAKEDGKTVDFKTTDGRKFFSGDEDANFQLIFENNGSVHLDPFAEVRITNLIGKEVKNIELEPWFSMPDSLRSREFSFNTGIMMGRYTATAHVYRGYGEISDPKSFDDVSLSFWVIPWQKVGLVTLLVFILMFIYRWFKKNFEFRRK